MLTHRDPRPRALRWSCVLVTVVGLGGAAGASGAVGRQVSATDNPPKELAPIRAAGVTCRADSDNFRAWWGESPGGAGALPTADGSCATIPPVVDGTLAAAESVRIAGTAAGYAPLVGDPPPVLTRNGAWYRRAISAKPALRARILTRTLPTTRGRLLAGLRPVEQRRLYRNLPAGLVMKLTRDAARAAAGRPADFVGGDRRVDVILDPTGATGFVGGGRAGVVPCVQAVLGASRSFRSATVVLLAKDATVPRAVLAHELFHVTQCMLGVPGATADLLTEGAAEWFSARTEPTDFAGTVVADATGVTVTGGATRAIGFCREFDPAAGGLSPYDSWAIWSALDLAAPGTVTRVLGAATGGGLSSPGAVLNAVGDPAWSAALLVAVREVCGNLRSPAGQPTFAQEVRPFFGAFRAVARAGAPVMVTLPAGGAISVLASWSEAATVSQVVVRLTAPGLAPEALAARLTAQAGATVVSTTSDPGAALVTITGAQLAERSALITIASPSIAAPTSITAEVTVTP